MPAQARKPKVTTLDARQLGQRDEIEQMLSERGVKWAFDPEFDLNSIDVDKSLANQARIAVPLNNDQMSSYKEAMQRGDRFPAIVVFPQSNGTYMVVDGNHRTVAAKEARYPLGAYILDASTPGSLVTILTYEANTKHGLPTTQSERAEHAVWLIENAQETIKAASARMNLPERLVSRYYANSRADDRARRLRVPAQRWRDLVQAARLRLNAIQADETFLSMVDLAWKARLSTEEVDALVIQIRQIGSVGDQLREVERWTLEQSDRIADAATGEVKPKTSLARGPRQSLRSSMNMLQPLKDELKRQQFIESLAPLEVQEWVERVDEAMSLYSGLKEELIRLAATE